MKYLGVDFGLRRVGLAVSEGIIASPYKVLESKGFSDLLEKIKKESVGFDKLVVGMPEGKMGQTVSGFITALRKAGLDVEEMQETLSSKKALEQMIKLNIPKRRRRVNDDIAAAIILQSHLDQR